MFMELIMDFVVIKSWYTEKPLCVCGHKLTKMLCPVNVLLVLHIFVLVEHL